VSGTRIISVDTQNPEREALDAALAVLRRGEVIVFPTETLYGLGCDAFDEAAVRRLYDLKRRDSRKPILVLAHDMNLVADCVAAVPGAAQLLAEEFWPGPLTIVLPASSRAPSLLTAGTGKIGIRIPSSPLCLKLIGEFGRPVTATSANLSGQKDLQTVHGLLTLFSGKVPLILDGGVQKQTTPSTVVDVTSKRVKLLREGVIPLARLHEVLHDIEVASV